MTYRRDSDIIHRYPFGSLVVSKTMRKSYGKTRPTANSVQRLIPHKKKHVAWITSICPTSVRRENYVRQLARHISVDIYGGCGHKYCGSHEQLGDISLTLSLSLFIGSHRNIFPDDFVGKTRK
jgi:alpha-1,3-fucosyltransferase